MHPIAVPSRSAVAHLRPARSRIPTPDHVRGQGPWYRGMRIWLRSADVPGDLCAFAVVETNRTACAFPIRATVQGLAPRTDSAQQCEPGHVLGGEGSAACWPEER